MSRAAGREAERRAEKLLRRRGYRILARNVTYRRGELDLVALDGEVLVFVEVRSRKNDRFGGAVASISATKRQRLRHAATVYLAKHPTDAPVRFDVVAFTGDRVEHLIGAF